jgi:hypothetical protein
MINITILLCVFLFTGFFLIKFLNIHKRNSIYKYYDKLKVIYDSSFDLAFKKIYIEKISLYHSSKIKFDGVDIEKVKKEFIQCLFLFLGDKVIQDLIVVHGSYETLCAISLNRFVAAVLVEESQRFNAETEVYKPTVINMEN